MPKPKEGGAKPKEWTPLSHEERTRHEALFFSQGPIEGLLPGEKARELFLKSKLPLHILSQIWNLVDVPHDNMLDHAEFCLAIRLLRWCLSGHKLPAEIPDTARFSPKPEVRLPTIKQTEFTTYKRLFRRLDMERQGFIIGIRARPIVVTAKLPVTVLADLWDLADVDRDGCLSGDEFLIICHLIRIYKKGEPLDGPVNAQSLLPHKLPRTDLAAKKAKLAELEVKKKSLMALKEKRKTESIRETKRLELWREKLKLLRLRHQVIQDSEMLPKSALEEEEFHIQNVEDSVFEMEAVAGRLTSEHERVRQETARAIVQEQKLSVEMKSLQEEAESLRQKRKRNSLIKDLDPFHQLYEEQKEEKLTGVVAPKKHFEIHIPQKIDPFDKSKLEETFMSGEDLFECHGSPPEGSASDPDKGNPWASNIDPDIYELTQGFEDNFVEVWGQTDPPTQGDVNRNVIDGLGSPLGSPLFLEKEGEFGFCFEDESDMVFRTIPVTAEDDDLWSSLPESVLKQTEQLMYVNNKLENNSKQLEEIDTQGTQLVFRNQNDYEEYARDQEEKREYESRIDSLAHTKQGENDGVTSKYAVSRSRSYHGDENNLVKARDPRYYIRKRHSLATQNNARASNDTDLYIASVRERLERIRIRSRERLIIAEKRAEQQNQQQPQQSVQPESVQDKVAPVTSPNTSHAPSAYTSQHHFSPSARGSVKDLIARRDSSRGSSDASVTDVEKVLESLDRAREERTYQKRRSITREKPVIDGDVVYSSAENTDSLDRRSLESRDSDHSSVFAHAPGSPELNVNNPNVSGDTCASDSDYGSSSSAKDIESHHKPQIPDRPLDLIQDLSSRNSYNNNNPSQESVTFRPRTGVDKRNRLDKTQSVFVLKSDRTPTSDTTDGSSTVTESCAPTLRNARLDKTSRADRALSWTPGDPAPVAPPRKNRASLKGKTPGQTGKESDRSTPISSSVDSSTASVVSSTDYSSASAVSSIASTSPCLSGIESPRQRPGSGALLHVDTEYLSSAVSTPSVSPSRSPNKPPRRGSPKRRAPLPPPPPPPAHARQQPRDIAPPNGDLQKLPAVQRAAVTSTFPALDVSLETQSPEIKPIAPPRKRGSVNKNNKTSSRVKLADTRDQFKTVEDSDTGRATSPTKSNSQVFTDRFSSPDPQVSPPQDRHLHESRFSSSSPVENTRFSSGSPKEKNRYAYCSSVESRAYPVEHYRNLLVEDTTIYTEDTTLLTEDSKSPVRSDKSDQLFTETALPSATVSREAEAILPSVDKRLEVTLTSGDQTRDFPAYSAGFYTPVQPRSEATLPSAASSPHGSDVKQSADDSIYQSPLHSASSFPPLPTSPPPPPPQPATDKYTYLTESAADLNMEAEARKLQLEKMRAGLFGGNTTTNSGTDTTAAATGGSPNGNTTSLISNTYTTDLTNSNVTITNTADSHTQKSSTLISIIDEGRRSPKSISYENTLAKTVLNISNDSPTYGPPKAEEFEDGFYDEDVVLKPAEGTLERKAKPPHSKFVLDLDQHAFRPEFGYSSDLLDYPAPPETPENSDFDMPHTSKIILTLDEDLYQGESIDHEEPLVETLIDIDNTFPTLGEPTDNKPAVVDNLPAVYSHFDPLDAYAATPLIPTHTATSEKEDILTTYLPPVSASTGMELYLANPVHSRGSQSDDLYHTNTADTQTDSQGHGLSSSLTPEHSLSISRTSSERDSDLSDTEGGFTACFEPGAREYRDGLLEDDSDPSGAAREASHDNSGIVLVSYQQRESKSEEDSSNNVSLISHVTAGTPDLTCNTSSHDNTGDDITDITRDNKSQSSQNDRNNTEQQKQSDTEAVRSFIDFFSSGPSSPAKQNPSQQAEQKPSPSQPAQYIASSSVSITLKQPGDKAMEEDKQGEALLIPGLEPAGQEPPPPLPDTPPPGLGGPLAVTPSTTTLASADLMMLTSGDDDIINGVTKDSGVETSGFNLPEIGTTGKVIYTSARVGGVPAASTGNNTGSSSTGNTRGEDGTHTSSLLATLGHDGGRPTSLSYTPAAVPEQGIATSLNPPQAGQTLVTLSPTQDTNPADMDPVTGLRKTGITSPVEKAIQFVEKTEPIIRIKKKNSTDNEPPDPQRVALFQEIEHGRSSIMNELRIKPKRMTSWVADNDVTETPAPTSDGKTESEIRYEERKKRMTTPDVVPLTAKSPVAPVTPIGLNNNSYTPSRSAYRSFVYGKPRDVDSRSIGNQEYTKKHWEKKLSEGDVRLFPPEPQQQTIKTSVSADDFKSDVDTESIANLNYTKQHWELKHERELKEKDQPKTPSTPKTPTTPKYTPEIRSHPENNNSPYKPPPNNNNYDDDIVFESAIDREIRLAQAREYELQREKGLLQQEEKSDPPAGEMPIRKVPPSLRVEKGEGMVEVEAPPLPASHPPPSYREMTEVDRDSDLLMRESIIEREIREQHMRETALKSEVPVHQPQTQIPNKEQEQSEWERQDKEQERIFAHESIIEREIRLQREREADLARDHSVVYQPPNQQPERVTEAPPPVPAQAPPPAPYYAQEEREEPPLLPVAPPPQQQQVYYSQQVMGEPTPAAGHPVQYEEAISTHAHDGESFIARELREQREREEELRKRYTAMGIDVPATVLSDTPYNMPEPTQPNLPAGIHVQTVSAPQRSGTYQEEVRPYKATPTSATAPTPSANERRPSLDSQNSGRSAASSAAEAGRGRVQPSYLPHQEEEPAFRYQPQEETPIEREIRRARDLEESLRRERGLPVIMQEKHKDVPVELQSHDDPVVRPNQLYRAGDEPGKGTMKRFANSRLQYEIEREKQRETELKQTGMIQTLSEERAGEKMRYKEVIPEGGVPARSPMRTPARTPVISTPPPIREGEPEPGPAPLANGTPVTPAATPTTPSGRPKVEPSVVRRYSTHTQALQVQEVENRGRPRVTESKIEQELREMREREQELMKQREMFKPRSSRPAPSQQQQQPLENGGSHNGPPAPEPEITYRPRPTTDNPKMRRKSMLAEEWEKKFGQSS